MAVAAVTQVEVAAAEAATVVTAATVAQAMAAEAAEAALVAMAGMATVAEAAEAASSAKEEMAGAITAQVTLSMVRTAPALVVAVATATWTTMMAGPAAMVVPVVVALSGRRHKA